MMLLATVFVACSDDDDEKDDDKPTDKVKLVSKNCYIKFGRNKRA